MNQYNAKSKVEHRCKCGVNQNIESVDLSESDIMNLVRGRILSGSFECEKCGKPIDYLLNQKNVDLSGDCFKCASLCTEIVLRQGYLLNSIDDAEELLSELEEEMFGGSFGSAIWQHDGQVYVYDLD